jgi:hypothetical protein
MQRVPGSVPDRSLTMHRGPKPLVPHPAPSAKSAVAFSSHPSLANASIATVAKSLTCSILQHYKRTGEPGTPFEGLSQTRLLWGSLGLPAATDREGFLSPQTLAS